MAKSRRRQVSERAAGRCEYCRLAETSTTLPHELDHIRAKKHHGSDSIANICYACAQCNAAKSSNASGYDPNTQKLVRLFNPRRDRWAEHFAWLGPTLLGKTAIGRATIDVLRINATERVEHRRMMQALDLFN